MAVGGWQTGGLGAGIAARARARSPVTHELREQQVEAYNCVAAGRVRRPLSFSVRLPTALSEKSLTLVNVPRCTDPVSECLACRWYVFFVVCVRLCIISPLWPGTQQSLIATACACGNQDSLPRPQAQDQTFSPNESASCHPIHPRSALLGVTRLREDDCVERRRRRIDEKDSNYYYRGIANEQSSCLVSVFVVAVSGSLGMRNHCSYLWHRPDAVPCRTRLFLPPLSVKANCEGRDTRQQSRALKSTASFC